MNLEAPHAAEQRLGEPSLQEEEKAFLLQGLCTGFFPPPAGVRLLSQLRTAVLPDALFISGGAGRWPRAMEQDGAVQL